MNPFHPFSAQGARRSVADPGRKICRRARLLTCLGENKTKERQKQPARPPPQLLLLLRDRELRAAAVRRRSQRLLPMRHQRFEEDDEEGVELSDNTRAATRRPPFARASAADLAGASRAHIAAAAQSFQLNSPASVNDFF